MWVPLVVLAILATVGGFIGISPAFTGGKHIGGRLNIVNWLEPVIWNPITRSFGIETSEELKGEKKAPLPTETVPEEHPAEKSAEVTPYGDHHFNLAHAVEEKFHSHTAAEWFFIVVSLVVAAFGILMGWLFYIKKPELPVVWARRLGPIYRASYNKYWVDELYAALFTRRTMDLSRGVFTFDSKVVDGGVNGTAWLTRLLSIITGAFDKYVVDGLVNIIAGFIKTLMSPVLRAAQTGLTANYALVMVIGLIIAIAIFYGGDIMTSFGG